MTPLHETIYEDLTRMMYEEVPDNIEEAKKLLEKHDQYTRSYNPETHAVKERPLFSEPIILELSKARPEYAKERWDMIVYGGACCALAVFSILVLPQPYNWIMGAGCFGPIVIRAIKRKKYGSANQNNK